MKARFIRNQEDVYQRFINTHPSPFDANFWTGGLNSKNKILGVFDSEELVATMKVYDCFRRQIFKALITPPLLPHVDIHIEYRTHHIAKQQSFYKQVLQAYIVFFRAHNYAFLELKFPERFTDVQPFIWDGYTTTLSYTYLLDLSGKDINRIRQSYTSNRRNKLVKKHTQTLYLKSFENRLTEEGKHFLMQRTTQKIKDINLKRLLSFITQSDHNYLVIEAKSNNRLEALVYIVYNHCVAYYLLGASSKHSTAWTACMDKAIEEMTKRKVLTFDFEGSMLPDIEKNFRSFGGKIMPKMIVKYYRNRWVSLLID